MREQYIPSLCPLPVRHGRRKKDFPAGKWAVTPDGRIIEGGDRCIIDASRGLYDSQEEALAALRAWGPPG